MLEIIFSGFACKTTKIKMGTNASAEVSSEPLFACRSSPVHQLHLYEVVGGSIPKITLQQLRIQIILSLGAL